MAPYNILQRRSLPQVRLDQLSRIPRNSPPRHGDGGGALERHGKDAEQGSEEHGCVEQILGDLLVRMRRLNGNGNGNGTERRISTGFKPPLTNPAPRHSTGCLWGAFPRL